MRKIILRVNLLFEATDIIIIMIMILMMMMMMMMI